MAPPLAVSVDFSTPPLPYRPPMLSHRCRGGTLSWVFRLPRVDTTLKLSVQSHWTCR